jgi:signal transduction histidine kinase
MEGFAADSVRNLKHAGIELSDADIQRERAILEAIEENQFCIAQELHDSVCQSLSGIRLSMAAIARKFSSASPISASDFVHLDHVASRAVGDLHEMIRSLQPVVIEPDGFVSALQQLAAEAAALDCSVVWRGNVAPPDAFTASQLFRMTRTAVKYVSARMTSGALTIDLEGTPEGLSLRVTAEEPCFPSALNSLECLFAWKLLKRQANAIGAAFAIEPDLRTFVICVPNPGN